MIQDQVTARHCTEYPCLSLYRALLLVGISLHACCLCLWPLNCFPQRQWCYVSAVDDMFWEQPWDLKAFAKECKTEWGVTPRPYWAQDKSVLHGSLHTSGNIADAFLHGAAS